MEADNPDIAADSTALANHAAEDGAAAAPPPPKQYNFKREKSQYGKIKKSATTYQRYLQSLADNPALDVEMQAEEPPPPPIVIHNPTGPSKRQRTDDNWRTNRAVAARDRKIESLEREQEITKKKVTAKLKQEKRKRVDTEKRLCNERQKRATENKKAKAALAEEKKRRHAAEKKVSSLFVVEFY